ncbi:MAG: transporter substrate-binding domain-containing protein [Rhodospirillaceae bacterium]|jgi:polar amino acid transport system substrate-binding protein|nr:transporter substrate-binding domain-containing protein [Rhodospirillaceae bacterium]MBT5194556.1 transporter substrate-binding domain-containing protein [Rhodospirillaceae bacterium]MBT5898901.1 transporter substrate-binding domain-containing protein [Rhodospirillaceae bacterium]MBT6430056.1 transporter substrate-binding domain-containing protein [Rhodospirillaceae bacterium]
MAKFRNVATVYLLFVVASQALLVQTVLSESAKTLIINTEHFPPLSTTKETGFEDLVAREMYRRVGYEIRLNFLPSERVLYNANMGIDDGLLSRVGGMAKKYPNLVQFEESLFKADYVAFSRKKNIRVAGWDSLKPYHVGIITGWKILEENITNAKELTKVKNAKALFSLLEFDRIDIAVFSKYSGLQIAYQRGLHDVRALMPPLATRKRYFYLHKKHRALASRASVALRAMKNDGSYKRIFDRTLGKLMLN